MSVAKFEVEKFNEINDFGLWWTKMHALLVQHDLEGVLEGEDNLPTTLTVTKKKGIMATAHSAIQLSLSNKVLYEVCDQTTTPGIWKKLEVLYMKKSLTNHLYFKQHLYQLKMRSGTPVSDHVDLFNQIIMDLHNVNVRIEDEDQALLLLYSLLESYENFVDTMLYG